MAAYDPRAYHHKIAIMVRAASGDDFEDKRGRVLALHRNAVMTAYAQGKVRSGTALDLRHRRAYPELGPGEWGETAIRALPAERAEGASDDAA